MPDLAKDIKEEVNQKAKLLKWSEKEASFNYKKAVSLFPHLRIIIQVG